MPFRPLDKDAPRVPDGIRGPDAAVRGPDGVRGPDARSMIPLGAVCAACEWHLAAVIGALQKAGLSRVDAEAFAAFAFAERAEVRDTDPRDHLNAEQWARLVDLGGGSWAVRP